MNKKVSNKKSSNQRNRSIEQTSQEQGGDNMVQRFGFGGSLFADMEREFQGVMEDFGMPRVFGRGSDRGFGSLMSGFDINNVDQEFDQFEE
jgi:hypothetical protein